MQQNLQKPALRKLILLLFSLPLLSEVFLQCIGLGHPALVTTDSPANYELLPNQSIYRTWPFSDCWISHVRTNHLGMRSEEVTESKAKGTLRIYFVGDSFTYGSTQVEQSELFTEIVHRELPPKLHQQVEVMNGAISGWAIANELAYVKEHGIVSADRVILVLNDGDPTQPMSPKPTGYAIPSTTEHPHLAVQEIWYRWLKPTMISLMQKHNAGQEDKESRDPGLDITINNAILQKNLSYLDELQAFVSAHGGKLSILYIPFRGVYDDVNLFERARIGQDAVDAWARDSKVPFLNIGLSVSRYPTRLLVLHDHTHYNTRGHRVIATAIEESWFTLSNG